MRTAMRRRAPWGLAAALSALLAACGGSDDLVVVLSTPSATRTTPPASGTPTTTAPPQTATPTATSSPGTGVAGVLVLRNDVAAGAPEVLGAPPRDWVPGADAAAFDHAMAGADWSIDGAAGARGVTASREGSSSENQS